MAKKSNKVTVETLTHEKATRKNIPTVEYQSVIAKEVENPIRISYERGATGLEEEKQNRNRDLDPQLVWRGKDEQDWSDLVVQAPPIYIQEKVHPKVLIDDLLRRSQADKKAAEPQYDLFADFNGLPDDAAKTDFYRHDANWSNRMILGDSLQVMASLAEREGLRGKVQCIYIDPPYGIKFNSNFQWSTTSRDVKDRVDHITREPEQVKAFRDTWRDGIHTYLTYLRDRLTVAQDLLEESGSIFLQIGDENVHRVRALMDEVFGETNFISEILLKKGGTATSSYIPSTSDFILFFAKNKEALKYRQLFFTKSVGVGETTGERYDQIEYADGQRRAMTKDEKDDPSVIPANTKAFKQSNPCSQHDNPLHRENPLMVEGRSFFPPADRQWSSNPLLMQRVVMANRIIPTGKNLAYVMYIDDFPVVPINNFWTDALMRSTKRYIVETAPSVVERCILMTTDPGDLVLDPTCGSGTSTYVSEQWGRRWITIDTSRVALALARARIMGARHPYYLLADSPEGQIKEAEVSCTAPSTRSTRGDIRQGFVYERVPHITLKSIANNAEIDVIWEKFQVKLESLRKQLNKTLGKKWEEWEIPREAEDSWDTETQKLFYSLKADQVLSKNAKTEKIAELLKAINHNLNRNYTLQTLPERPVDPWPEPAQKLHSDWWQFRIARQKEIDGSIVAKAEFEYLYDKPYEAKKTVRVAGPFTVESLSPHRVLGVDENDELIDSLADKKLKYGEKQDFAQMILENLKTSGVQQAHKEDKIVFTSLTPWPGELICAEGKFKGSGEWLVKSEEKKQKTPELVINNSPLSTASSLSTDVLLASELRAAIFIGPEFGTVSRPDLVAAAREAGDGGFDVLITCAFNYDAPSTEFNKLGRIPVLKARMNADLHMADDLKNTGKGNLFVIFGEPDIEIINVPNDQIQVKVNGVDVFHPTTGEARSDGAEGIACWFIDTDYNEESFFVRHAYFLGANDSYKSLKTTLKTEINEDAWSTLNSDTSRPFDKPQSGRIAVKVINHLGDEVMKVFKMT